MDNDNNIDKKGIYELKKADKQKEAARNQQKRTVKRVLLWTGVVFVLFGVIWGMVKLAGNQSQQLQATLNDAVSDSNWTKGGTESEVILLEYGDFQCPACAAFYRMLKPLEQEYGSKVRFVYRHFPLR